MALEAALESSPRGSLSHGPDWPRHCIGTEPRGVVKCQDFALYNVTYLTLFNEIPILYWTARSQHSKERTTLQAQATFLGGHLLKLGTASADLRSWRS